MNYGLSPFEQQAIIKQVNKIAELKEAGIMYIGKGMCQQIRKSDLPKGLGTWIVIKEVKETTPERTPVTLHSKTKTFVPTVPENEGNIKKELLNMGLSCGATILAGVATVGSAAAAPVTAGTSTALTVVAYAGTTATAAQCGIAIGRVFNETQDPKLNQILDNDIRYKRTSQALDAVALAGAGASITQGVKGLSTVKNLGGNVTWRSFIKELIKNKGQITHLSRQQQKQLAKTLALNANLAGSGKQFKALVRAGAIPGIYKTFQISKAVQIQLVNGIASAMGYASSTYDGLIKEVMIYILSEK